MSNAPGFAAAEVARLHARCLDQGFLVKLGPAFLTLLYEAMHSDPSAVVIVETDPQTGRVIGFVAGGHGMGPIYRAMARRVPKLALVAVSVLVRPRLWRGVFEVMRHSTRARTSAALPEAELFAIAVDPAARGTGTAQRLFHRLEDTFRASGDSGFRIVVGDGLDAAHRFYRKMGAVPAQRTEVHAGRGSTVYQMSLAR